MLLDLSPLRRHRDFRLVYAGQFVSALGNFLTGTSLQIQIWQLTHDSAYVGMLGVAQLIPLAATALWGGAVADAIDRRRLLLWSEALMACGALALVANAMSAQPSVALVFAVAAFLSGVTGFHRPALEALTQRLVAREDLPAVSALSSLRSTVAMVGGPALASLCIDWFGMATTYGLNAASFAASLAALAAIGAMPPTATAPVARLASIVGGLRYAASRPELIGTYVVDIVAMTFAMPTAVLPELAKRLGNESGAGYLLTAMSVGSLLVTLFSGWTHSVRRHGAAVLLAAAAWGLAIVPLGYAQSWAMAALWLALAGAADNVSTLFRMTMWNETIPPELRGRMASIEQLSYMSGPLLGNMRAGFMSAWLGLGPSIAWGGGLCVAGVLACVPLLPAFWRYRRTAPPPAP